jgi:hypothetical protein
MPKRILAVAGLMWMMGPSALAADLCNCCGDTTAASCVSACTTIASTPSQCVPTVDFSAKPDVGPGKNALYEFSLRNLKVQNTDPTSLELYRRLLEKLRKGVEADRKAALWDRHDGKIDAATATSLAKRYDDAIVNYYLGAQAYRLAKTSAQ